MKDETPDRRRDLPWALPASLVLHALLVALLIYGLPRSFQPPPQEQAVNVALVPPPDQPKPKPVPAPPPKQPKAEKPPVPKPEKPPQLPEKQPPKPVSIEVLKPVFQFGDKDSGPKKSLDGGSARDHSTPLAKDSAPMPPTEAQNAENQAPEAKGPEAVQNTEKQAAAAPTLLTAPSNDGEIALPASAQVPQSRPTDVPKRSPPKVSKARGGATAGSRPADVSIATSQRYSGLPGVRKLYSQGATGDALATTAMADVPRDRRAARLCASELQQQLQGASYFPDLVPMIPLKAGNILDIPETAFHTGTTWYNLSFRCEVDPNATTVLSFTFRVGTAIPPNEWARLGLPVRY